MVPPADKQTIVASFLEVAVGQTTHTAHRFLEAANWVIEDALECFYLGNEGRVAASSSYVPPAQHYVLQSDHNHSLLEDAKGNVFLGQGVGDEAHPPLPMDSDTPCSADHIMTQLPQQPVRIATHIDVPTSTISHVPGPAPCISGQVVKRRRGRPRKSPLVSGMPPLVVEPEVAEYSFPPFEVSTSNMPSVPVRMPCGSGEVVKRRRGRPRKTPLVVDTSLPVVEPVLPPVEAGVLVVPPVPVLIASGSGETITPRQGRACITDVATCSRLPRAPPTPRPIDTNADYVHALVENVVAESGCMPSTSARSRRYKRPRQSQLETLGSSQLMPPRSKRTRSQIDAVAHALGSSSQQKSVIQRQCDPVYKALAKLHCLLEEVQHGSFSPALLLLDTRTSFQLPLCSSAMFALRLLKNLDQICPFHLLGIKSSDISLIMIFVFERRGWKSHSTLTARIYYKYKVVIEIGAAQ